MLLCRYQNKLSFSNVCIADFSASGTNRFRKGSFMPNRWSNVDWLGDLSTKTTQNTREKHNLESDTLAYILLLGQLSKKVTTNCTYMYSSLFEITISNSCQPDDWTLPTGVSQSRNTKYCLQQPRIINQLSLHERIPSIKMNSTSDSINVINSNNTSAYLDESFRVNQEIGGMIRIYQLNIEGISQRKCEFLTKQISDENIDIIALQETHLHEDSKRAYIGGFTLVAAKFHKQLGLATYVRNDLLPATQVLQTDEPFHTTIKVNDQTIVNVYKPPSAEFDQSVLPQFEKPSFVCGDFNSHNTMWGYDDTNNDGRLDVKKRLFIIIQRRRPRNV